MIITITQEMINQGVPGDNCNCPLAHAFKAALNKKWVSVGRFFLTYYPSDAQASNLPLPDAARQFLKDFDSARIVFPMQFELDMNTASPEMKPEWFEKSVQHAN